MTMATTETITTIRATSSSSSSTSSSSKLLHRRCCYFNCSASLFLLLLLSVLLLPCRADDELKHPDPNDEHYENMIYIGRHYDDDDTDTDFDGSKSQFKSKTKTRVGFNTDNSIRYIFGTSFDETHKDVAEEDLLHDSSSACASAKMRRLR